MKTILSLILAFGLIFSSAAAENLTGEALVNPVPVPLLCPSAILIEPESGQIIFEMDADEKRPVASVTKIMAILLACEALEEGRAKADDIVTVSKTAAGMGGSQVLLDVGEVQPFHVLLKSMIVGSANDATVAMGEYLYGSHPLFVDRMNERAKELGCTDTHFVNSTGLPAEGHYTTARDLALIAREAMSHERFREIVSTRRATIPWEGRSYQRILNNKNRLLTEYSGATGIKTGYTKAAGRCLVFGAKRDGMEVIGVVLHCGNWFEEAARLMDEGFERYEMFPVLEAGETVRVLPVNGGKQETVCVLSGGRLAAPVRKGTVPVLEYDLPETVEAGGEEGSKVGEARMIIQGEVAVRIPLVLGQSLAKRDYGFEVERMLRNWPSVPQVMAE